MTGPALRRENPHFPWRRVRRLGRRRSEGSAADGAAEVFPWLEHAAAGGAALGAILATGLGWACELGAGGLVYEGFLGAIAGALGGACLALNWAVERPAPPAGPRDLWDPWLDESNRPATAADDAPTRPPEDAVVVVAVEGVGEAVGGIVPERARVRPRVFSAESGETLPLEDEVAPLLAAHASGAIGLVGAAGAGKTTALRHLAGLVPPYYRVTFLDEPAPPDVAEAAGRGLVIYTAGAATAAAHLATLRFAPWGRDEWIEFLLAGGRDLCASVMARLARAREDADQLDGIPELWRIVLDRMAAAETVLGPDHALRLELDARLADLEFRELVEADCLAAVIVKDSDPIQRAECLRRHGPDEGLFRLIRHRPVQLLLAADRLAADLKLGRECEVLAKPLPRDLVRAAAACLAADAEAASRLGGFLADADRRRHPMAASLLHALRIGWKPDSPLPRLEGAYLEAVSWAEIDLTDSDLRGADLSRANLAGAGLEAADLQGACLAGASLRAATLGLGRLDGADLSRADLVDVRADHARFPAARLAAARLERARLERAIFQYADLTGAGLKGASLVGADLTGAKLDGADFSGADLSRAVLRLQKLAGARFAGARFVGANLADADLEGMVLPRAVFAEADLTDAYLTGSRMPHADFRAACLLRAGLAEVEWEGACLRGADLRNATFHLGSSRSGLVGSPIACEGSRTGFYTDDCDEQDFKSPEEIRKANLCGADLRGARIDGTDFYLVDLRGARVDPGQVPHLRRCGAILEART